MFSLSCLPTPNRLAVLFALAWELKGAAAQVFDMPFAVSSSNNGLAYSINCTVGSPPQNLTMALRISISDSQVGNLTYNTTASSTYFPNLKNTQLDNSTLLENRQNETNLNLYGLAFETILYASDNFTFSSRNGSVALNAMQFVGESLFYYNYQDNGTSDKYTNPWLGLGFAAGQARVWDAFPDTPEPSFTQALINKGAIHSNTFSIWLDEDSKSTGHVLLGGINSKRYHGDLVNIPATLTTTSDHYGFLTQPKPSIEMESLVIAGKTTIKPDTPGITLTHEPYSTFPNKTARAIWDAVGAVYDKRTDEHMSQIALMDSVIPAVPCSFLVNSSTIDIKFSGAPNLTLSIPMSDITTRNGDGKDSATCQLLIRAWPDGIAPSFGAGMLKSLYTVFDQDNNIVSLALTNFNTTEDNLIAIPKKGVSAISKDLFPPETSPTTTPSPSGAPSPSPSAEPNKTPVIIGASVGVPLFLILSGLVGFFLIRRRRKNRYLAVKKGEGMQYTGPNELGGVERKPGELHAEGLKPVKGDHSTFVSAPSPSSKSTTSTTVTRHEMLVPTPRHELA